MSVIIPVYNAAKYLEQCVKSVTGQTYKHLDIILVDDGSTDGSGAMCDEFAKEDDRVSVIHTENRGPASARNTGIGAAKGRWLLFMDSDDWYYTDDVIETLVCKAGDGNSEIICFNYRRFFEDNGRFSDNLCNISQPGQAGDINYLVDNRIYTSSPCLKLISKDILADNSISFEPGVWAEDIEFCGKLLLVAKNVSFCDEAVYVYRRRTDSRSTTYTKSNIDDLLYVVDKLSKAENRTDFFNSYLAFQYCTLLINSRMAKRDKSVMKKVFSYRYLLEYDSCSVVKMVHLATRLGGIAFSSRLLHFYYKYFLQKG